MQLPGWDPQVPRRQVCTGCAHEHAGSMLGGSTDAQQQDLKWAPACLLFNLRLPNTNRSPKESQVPGRVSQLRTRTLRTRSPLNLLLKPAVLPTALVATYAASWTLCWQSPKRDVRNTNLMMKKKKEEEGRRRKKKKNVTCSQQITTQLSTELRGSAFFARVTQRPDVQ